MSESVNEVDGMRRSDRGGAFIWRGGWLGGEVEVKEDEKEQKGRYGKVEKEGKKASC